MGLSRKLPLRTRSGCRHFRTRVQSLAAVALAFPTIAALLQLSMVGSAMAEEANAPIVVEVDRATLIQMPAKRRTLVIGDPRIARATYLSGSNQVVVTGLSFGETRMTVLEEAGEVVATSIVLVKEAANAGITIYRGQERGTYFNCDHLCQPRLRLGDVDKQFGEVGGQIRSREDKLAEPHVKSGAHL